MFRALWTLNISVGNAGGVALLHGNILGTVLAILEVARYVLCLVHWEDVVAVLYRTFFLCSCRKHLQL